MPLDDQDGTGTEAILASRAHLLARLITWSVDGDFLMRESSSGRRDQLRISDLQAVRVWQALDITGDHLEARLRIADRWWSMSGHHVEGFAHIIDRSKDLSRVLNLVIHRRLISNGNVDCRIGNNAHRIGAWLFGALGVAMIAAILYSLTTSGLPEKRWMALGQVFCAVTSLILVWLPFTRRNKRHEIDPRDLVRHPLLTSA